MVNHCRNSQFELNTLKISQETKRVVRRPYVWEKPGSRLYDYHYEIGGMYYQPMIKYIMHRGETGPRQVVDIPDRILSDFDKRAYTLNNDDMGLEDFLTDAYRRRAKDVNAKYVHVENEKIRQSKRNTELNMVRGSACIRDKYLCQLQLYFTGKEAQLSLEGESAQTQIKRDDSYGPAFSKISTRKPSETANLSVSEEINERTREDTTSLGKLKMSNHLQLLNQATKMALERGDQTKTVTMESSSQSSSEVTTSTTSTSATNATYTSAYSDVKNQVDKMAKLKQLSCGVADGPKLLAKDVDIAYGGVKIDQAGCHLRSRLKADQYRPRRVPDLDVGYETIARM